MFLQDVIVTGFPVVQPASVDAYQRITVRFTESVHDAFFSHPFYKELTNAGLTHPDANFFSYLLINPAGLLYSSPDQDDLLFALSASDC